MASMVLVNGLPPTFSTDHLRSLFMPFGTVRSAVFASPTRGNNLGSGYVQMASDSEALLAVKVLHGLAVSGHPIATYLW
jgi:RNA recognition motif-containing protein